VEVARPGSVYHGSRFDWTGFVTQVTLNGEHIFCVPESLTPGKGSGGRGLCNEFGIHEPIGYEDTRVGEKFPKLGVGLLTRPDDGAYDFFRPYEIEPFPIQVATEEDRVIFTVEPLPCRGYEARLTKTLSLHEHRLRIDYRLENVGTELLETTEYYHNFIGIDGHAVGGDYRLRLPYPIELPEAQEIFDIKGNELRWRWQPEGDFYGQPRGFGDEPGHRWELIHKPSGVGLREESRFKVERVALWGTTHVISPEAFIKIAVAPGDEQTWCREYEFFD
jgi:hypothetical protein